VGGYPVGLAADVLTPTIPGTGIFKALRGASGVERLAEVASRLPQAGRKIEDVISAAAKTSHAAEDAAHAAETLAKTDEAANVLARTGSSEAARVAAGVSQANTFADNVRRVVMEDGPPGGKEAAPWMKSMESLGLTLLAPFKTFMENHPGFRGLGGAFAQKLESQGNIKRALLGEGKARMDEIVRLLPTTARHKEWLLAMHGLAEAKTPEVQKAVQLTKAWAGENFAALDKRGTRMAHGVATIAYSMLGNTEKIEAASKLKWLEGLNLGDARQVPREIQEALEATTEGRMALDLFHLRAEIGPAGVIKAPLKARGNYLPAVLTRAARKRESQQGAAELAQALQRYGLGMSPEEASNAAKHILGSHAVALGDVRKSLQFSRGDLMSLDTIDNFVQDPRQILSKMATDNADLLASVETWGGKHELYDAWHLDLARAHGLSAVPGAIEQVPQEYRAAAETATKAFNIQNGTLRDELNPVLGILNKISDHIFLGPRTVLIQPTTISNVGALAGVGNSMLGIQEALVNSPIRHLVERLGAHIPTMLDAPNDARGLAKLRSWNPILHMVGKADRGMRVSAAISGGLHAAETEEKVLAAVRAGNMAKAEKMAGFLQRTHGIDTAGLLRGERLSDAAMMQAMTNTAHLTNFTGDVTALPKAFQSSAGQFFLKFKQYSMQQSSFISRLVAEGKEHKNWGPLLRYAAMFPWTYNSVLRAVNNLKHAEKQNTPDQGLKYVADMLMIGSMGYIGDVVQALASPSEALSLGFVAGPNAAAIFKLSRGVRSLLPVGEGGAVDWSGVRENLLPQSARQVLTFGENVSE
jgi:hypothetical protein